MAILHIVPIELKAMSMAHYYGGLYEIENGSMTLNHVLHLLTSMIREDIISSCDIAPNITFEVLPDTRYLLLTISFPEIPCVSENCYHVYLYNNEIGVLERWNTKDVKCQLDILNRTNKYYDCTVYDMVHSTYYVKRESASDPYDLCAKISGYFGDYLRPSVKESSNVVVFYDKDYNPVVLVHFSEE